MRGRQLPLSLIIDNETPCPADLGAGLRIRQRQSDSVTGLHDGRSAETRDEFLPYPTAGLIPATPANPIRSKLTRTGLIAFHRLCYITLQRGLIVSESPEGCIYDFVLDCHGRLFRTQLKSRDFTKHNGPNLLGISFGRSPKTKRLVQYGPNDLDAMIIYVPSLDRFLWLPPEVFVGKNNISIMLVNRRGVGKPILFDDVVWNP